MICLVDERISKKAEAELERLGFHTLRMPSYENLGSAVCSHPDMLLFYHSGNIITSRDYYERNPDIFDEIKRFSNASVTLSEDTPNPSYPYDSVFNALVIDDCILLKEDTVSKSIKDYAKEQKLRVINTKQGYPACTVLAFGRSAITADRGILRALKPFDIKTTEISNSDTNCPAIV